MEVTDRPGPDRPLECLARPGARRACEAGGAMGQLSSGPALGRRLGPSALGLRARRLTQQPLAAIERTAQAHHQSPGPACAFPPSSPPARLQEPLSRRTLPRWRFPSCQPQPAIFCRAGRRFGWPAPTSVVGCDGRTRGASRVCAWPALGFVSVYLLWCDRGLSQSCCPPPSGCGGPELGSLRGGKGWEGRLPSAFGRRRGAAGQWLCGGGRASRVSVRAC